MSKPQMTFLVVVLATTPLLAIAQSQPPAPTTAEPAPTHYTPPRLGAPGNRVSGATRGLTVEPTRTAAPTSAGREVTEKPAAAR